MQLKFLRDAGYDQVMGVRPSARVHQAQIRNKVTAIDNLDTSSMTTIWKMVSWLSGRKKALPIWKEDKQAE